MASPFVQLSPTSTAKVRDPGMVLLFFFLTLGFLVYPQVWYYRINRELRDYGQARGDDELGSSNPVWSVLAVTLFAILIVPPIVSWYRCTQRIKRAQELGGITDRLNGWWIVGLYVAGFIFSLPALAIPYIVQENLNKVWKPLPEQGSATDASMMSSADQVLASDPALQNVPPPDPSERKA